MSNRVRTRERRKQREQQRQRNRQILILGAVVVVAVVAVVLVIFANQPAEAVISEATIAQYVDVPQSISEEGFPILGNPDAPVAVVEYSSFDCSACALFYENVSPTLIDRALAGEISFTYVPLYGTGGIANGQGAARAAVCASEQDAFWAYHGALFTWQGTYGNQAFAGNRLRTGITNLGLNMGEWDACFGSDRPDEVLVAANADANSLESFTGTPTVTVNGVIIPQTLGDINAAIDAALASAPPIPATPTEATPEVTAEASE